MFYSCISLIVNFLLQGTQKKMNKNLIWRTIIAIIFISCLTSSTTFVLSQQTENDETDTEILGKPCSQSFHCWRTEPVSENGMPLSLTNRISKRIDLAGIARSKGGMLIVKLKKLIKI